MEVTAVGDGRFGRRWAPEDSNQPPATTAAKESAAGASQRVGLIPR
jgi:hypothetical protein